MPALAINCVTPGYADGNPLMFCVPFCVYASNAATISCHFDWSALPDEFVMTSLPGWLGFLRSFMGMAYSVHARHLASLSSLPLLGSREERPTAHPRRLLPTFTALRGLDVAV